MEALRIAIIEPAKDPELTAIEADENGSYLAAMQNLVGGLVEPMDVLYGMEPSLYVNEESLLNGSTPNRAVYATAEMERIGYLSQMDGHPIKEGELYTVLFGTILAVSYDPETGESRDITPEEYAKVQETFSGRVSQFSGYMEVAAIIASREG